ncbi:MAG: ribose 5-phosphate isomerase A [Nitrososphaerales archaeon]
MKGKLEEALEKASELLLEKVKPNIIVGLGSGSSVARFVKRLKGYNLKVVCSSWQIQLIAEEMDLEVLSQLPKKIDLHVDGADQISEEYSMIKGYGGALFKEKLLMLKAKERIIIADEQKFSKRLNKPVPVEFIPFSKNYVEEALIKIDGKPSLRLLEKGYPYITDNGNFIFDTNFGEIKDAKELEKKIKAITGVLEVGLFNLKLSSIYKAKLDGEVEILVFKI